MATRKAQETKKPAKRANRATRTERRAIVKALGEEPEERGAGPSPRNAVKKMQAEGKVKGPTAQKSRRNAARRARRLRNGKPPICHGTNSFGEPCGCAPLKNGTEIEGSIASGDYCLRHEPSMPADIWKRFMLDPATEAIRAKPPKPRPLELLSEAVRQQPGLMFRGHLRTLGLDWDPDTDEFTVIPGGGAKIVGFSREGVARVSKHDDLGAWREAEKSLMDRIWGKPRQAMDMGFGDAGAAVVIPNNPERNNSVAKVLIECGALEDPTKDDSPLE